MIEIDGLDSAKCQKSRRRDTLGIYKIVNEKKDKNLHSVVFFNLRQIGQWLERREAVGASFVF